MPGRHAAVRAASVRRPGGPPAAAGDLSQLARGGALNLAGAVANGLLSFVLTVVVTRGLRAGGAGAFFEAVALFMILSSIAGLGADAGLSRTIPRYRALGRARDIRRGLAVGMVPVAVAGVVLAACMFAFAPELARVFARRGGTDRLAELTRSLAPFLPVYAVSIAAFAGTRGLGTMRPSALLDKVARPALQPLLVAAVLAAGAGSTAIAVAWGLPFALALAAALAWLAVLARRAERRRPDAAPARPLGELAADFWRFTGPRGLAVVFQTTSLWLSTLLIGALRSTREAGVYTAATRYLVAGAFVALAIRQVMAPKISELLAQRLDGRAGAVFQTTTCWMVGLNWPIYLVLVAYGPALLRVFGSGFGEGQVALVILAATMLLATAVGPVDVVLLMGGRSSWNLLNTVLALATNLLLNLALTPRLGLAGAGLAFAGGILVNNLLPLAQVWRLLRLHPFGRGTLVVAGIAAACFGVVGLAMRALAGPSVPAFLAYAVLSCALYAAALWRFRERLELPALAAALLGHAGAGGRGGRHARRSGRHLRGTVRMDGRSPGGAPR
ncbi:MAG TPA: lipopolysaccharide biosynthesis protein [Actinomycetes bacterium]|nr:lipopolysaccharide biosynthesis protein [Actinomycetes bacterium]